MQYKDYKLRIPILKIFAEGITFEMLKDKNTKKLIPKYSIEDIATNLNMSRENIAYRVERYYFYRLLRRSVNSGSTENKRGRKGFLYSISMKGLEYLWKQNNGEDNI